VNTGTAGQFGYYNANGTTISGTSAITLSNGNLSLHASSTSVVASYGDEPFELLGNGGTSGALEIVEGTTPTETGTGYGIIFGAPASVTGYKIILPGTAPSSSSSVMTCTNATPSICSWISPGGTVSSGTIGQDAVYSALTTVAGLPYMLHPFSIDTGAGTEASPWANSTDSTAGIQTQINSLASVRGGWVPLAAGRYTVATPITLTTSGLNVDGLSAGYQIDPDGQAEGTTGTKLNCTGGSCFTLGSASPRVNGTIQNVFVWGDGSLSTQTAAKSAFNFANYTDQFHIQHIALANFGACAYFGATGYTDAALLEDLDCDGNGAGIIANASGATDYLKITKSVIADNTMQGLNLPAAASLYPDQVTNNTFVRNCNGSSCSSSKTQALFGSSYGIFSHNIAALGGVCLGGSLNCTVNNTGVDGIQVTGPSAYIGANVFEGNLGYGVHVTSTAYAPIIAYNTFGNNTSGDVLIDSGATNTFLYGPFLHLTDNGGTRTTWNNVSTNAGDPASTGQWFGSGLFYPGLALNDTTNGVGYFYFNSSFRAPLFDNTYVKWSSTTGVNLTAPSTTGNALTLISSDLGSSAGNNALVFQVGGGASDYAAMQWNNSSSVEQGSFGYRQDNNAIFTYVAGNNVTWNGTGNSYATAMQFSGANSFFGIAYPAASTGTSACYNTSATGMSGFYTFATCTSLRKYKTEIRPLDTSKLEPYQSSLAEIGLLKPVSYLSKTSGRRELGFIAEDVVAVDPRISSYDKDGKLVGVQYDHIVALLTKAVQEQQAEIESLKQEVKELESTAAKFISNDNDTGGPPNSAVVVQAGVKVTGR
jgi:hypothetical protein